ncbi:MAG: M48 family metalloprotease [Pseudomonadota bacterium]
MTLIFRVFTAITIVIAFIAVVIWTGRWTVVLTPAKWEHRLWALEYQHTRKPLLREYQVKERYRGRKLEPEFMLLYVDDGKAYSALEALDSIAKKFPNSFKYPRGTFPHLFLGNDRYPRSETLWAGNIVIREADLKSASSEDEIAFILAHEFSHVSNRHVARSNGGFTYIYYLLSFFDVSILEKTSPIIERIKAIDPTQTEFVKHTEFQADLEAFKALCDTYQHGTGAILSLTKIRKIKGDDPQSKTHPTFSERIKRLEAFSNEIGCSIDGELLDKPESIIELSIPSF